MKMRCIMALCGTMAFVLAGCGSEIVESAVTETQVIDVNEPSAVEQAVQNTDYDFVDETQDCIALAEQNAEDKNLKEVLKRCEDSELWYSDFAAFTGDENSYYVCLPDDTCIPVQEAVNRAGKLFEEMQLDTGEQFRVISEADENSMMGRMRYTVWLGKSKNEIDGSVELEAATGKIIGFSHDKVMQCTDPYDPKGCAESGKRELQGYLDAVGAGQQCQKFAYDKTIDPYMPGTVRTIYKAKVDSMDWEIVIVGGKIQSAQAEHWKWEA